MQAKHTLFGQRLVKRNIITQQQLDEAIHKQQSTMGHRRIGEIFVRLGYISKSQVTTCLADHLGIPFLARADCEVSERIRGLVPKEIAVMYRVIPVAQRSGKLVIATSDPTDLCSMDTLSSLLDHQLDAVFSTPDDISEALNKYYGGGDDGELGSGVVSRKPVPPRHRIGAMKYPAPGVRLTMMGGN